MLSNLAFPRPMRLALAAALTAGALAGSGLAADSAFASKAGCDQHEQMPKAGGTSPSAG